MDAETERHMAALLLEEAARLRREAEISGVSAYLAKPAVRGRPNANFLTATVRNVQQANRMVEINEMWSRRSLELDHQGHETTRHMSRRRTSDNHDVDADVAREGGRRHREHPESSSRHGRPREKRGSAAMDSVEEDDADETRRRKRLRERSRERDGRSAEEQSAQRFPDDEDYRRRHRLKMRGEEAAEAENLERESGKQRKRSRADREQSAHGEERERTWGSHGEPGGRVAGDSDDEVAGRGANGRVEAGNRKRHRYGGSGDEEGGEGRFGPEVGPSEEDEGLDDDGIQQFLQSRVKRGRGAVGSRVDEPGPYLPRPDGDLGEEGGPSVLARGAHTFAAKDKDTCRPLTSSGRSQIGGSEPRGGMGNGHTEDVEDVPNETLREKKEAKRRRKRKRERERSDDDTSGDSSDESEGHGERGRRRKERAKEKRRGKRRAGSRSTVSDDDVHATGFRQKKRKRESERERKRERESSESGREERGSLRRRSKEGKQRKRRRKRSGSRSEEEEGELVEDRKRMKHRE